MIFFKFLVFGVFAFPMEEIPDTGMRALARDFSGLQEILFSSESFEKKQNSTLIENSLDSMEQHIRRLREVTFKDRIAFEAEIAFLQSNIVEARQAFGKGDRNLSRQLLKGALPLCVQCHSRTKSLDLTFPEVRLLGASKEEKATYYFATRQFEKGKTLIEELLRGGVSFPEHAESHMAKVLVVYFVRIKSDPNEAALFFKKLKKEKKRDWKFDIDGWIRDFENWGKEKAEDEFVLTKDELLRMSRRFLKRRNGNIACSLVNCLRASVYLHGLLEEAKSSKKGTGLALLWLGEIYERVGDPFFAPSADFFWKACISKFPHQFIAKKCFKKIVDFEKRKGLKIDPGERSRLKGLAN